MTGGITRACRLDGSSLMSKGGTYDIEIIQLLSLRRSLGSAIYI